MIQLQACMHTYAYRHVRIYSFVFQFSTVNTYRVLLQPPGADYINASFINVRMHSVYNMPLVSVIQMLYFTHTIFKSIITPTKITMSADWCIVEAWKTVFTIFLWILPTLDLFPHWFSGSSWMKYIPSFNSSCVADVCNNRVGMAQQLV